ncbi:MAG: alcohol dehydrogenase catalytic domain-containing protein [Sphaerochaetaceae bacterium]|nr:alcohol dehydrogenase catalytic domain-containing protein [Sphaerochaetaceae bacterium]
MINTSAWVIDRKKIELRNESLKDPGPKDIRVRVKACGICGTDMHFYTDYPLKRPIPLGHEVAGIVEQVGSLITDVTVGTAVVVQNNIDCGTCEQCRMRRPDRCRNIRSYMDDNAGIATYLTVERRMVIPFSGLSYAEATLAEPLTVALDLFQEADVRKEDSVLILGPGVIGLLLLHLISLSGAQRIVVAGHNLESARGRYRTEVAHTLGAHEVVDTANDGWKNEVKRSSPSLFDKVIITSPPRTIPDGIEMAGFGGWIVFDGISYSDEMICFDANDFHFNKKRLIASHAIPNYGFPYALERLKKEPKLSELLLTHHYTLDEIERAFEGYSAHDQRIIKTVIEIPYQL